MLDHRDRISDIREDLKALREEQKDGFKTLETTITKRLDHHSGRIRSLELWRAYIIGIAAAIATLVSIGWQWVASAFRGGS